MKRMDQSGMMVWLILLVLLVVSGAGVYIWKKQSDKDNSKPPSTSQQSADTAKPAESTETPGAAQVKVPSAELVENIKAVFASGNSAALEGYMAPTVRVIVANSDGIGDRTPAQATADITSYMTNATVPWDFSLPASILSPWQSGDYSQYFPANAVVGKSDELVISFTFNSDNKISGVFWTNHASSL